MTESCPVNGLVEILELPKKLSSVHTIVVAEVDSDLLENISIR